MPRCCCCRPRGSTTPGARLAVRYRFCTVDIDANGTVTLSGTSAGAPVAAPALDETALVLHTSGSTGRPKRVPLSHANLSISAANVARGYAAVGRRRGHVRDAAVPRPRARGLDAGHAVDRRHGGRPHQVQPAVLLGLCAGRGRHLVLGGAHHSPAAARARQARRTAAGRRSQAAVHPLVQRVAAAAGHARSRGGVRRARARGLRHDRGRAPDGDQPAAASGPPAGLGRDRHRRQDHDPERGRTGAAGRRARRSLHPGSQRHHRLREQPRGQRHRVLRRHLVPHRRSGRAGRERLPDVDRTPEGDDQPRRREDLAARDRRGAARPSVGGRGGVLRHAASHLGRGSGGGGAAEGAGRRRPTCWPSARSAWPTSNGPRRSTSPTPSRARRPARSSAA